jgi:peptidoglycan/LPS O-acetylase OafA/YrhL
MSISTPARDINLDLLRAIAIVSVVLYHLLQWSPVDPEWLDRAAHFGSNGVDLFFVLSGFLIGSIYWREERASGHVKLRRFLQRRWIRTIPPYLAALLLAWAAVHIARGQSFDARYLLFAQNYLPQMPFFQVSWSLCVEEHFYLVVPLMMTLIGNPKGRLLLFAIGALAPALFRWHYAPIGTAAPFGFYQTATHIRFEGLTLGFALAWVHGLRQPWWHAAQRYAAWLLAPLLVIGWLVATGPAQQRYTLFPSVVALLCSVLLVLVAGRKPLIRGALAPPVRAIAITSYSVYLVHPLMIHVGNSVNAYSDLIGDRLTLFVVWPLLIAGFGSAFYYSIERGALRLRERWAPEGSRGIATTPGRQTAT